MHYHASAPAGKDSEAKKRTQSEAPGSDSIVDSLELRLEEVLLELTDQEMHSLVRIGSKKNTFQIGLCWTFEENVSKAQ